MNTAKLPRWKRWLFRLAAVGISLLFALLLCEILVRVIAPQNLSGTWLEKSARGGLINRANWTVRHQLYGRVLHYRFNDLRLRGPAVSAATNRLLVVGDSFTFGWLVEETNTCVHKLNEFAARDFPPGAWTVLNGGTAGWGTADYVAFVEDFGPQIRPAAVVVFLSNDDVARSLHSGLFRLDAANANSLVATKPQFVAAGLRDAVRSFWLYRWSLEHLHLAQLIRLTFEHRVNRINQQKVQAAQGADADAAAAGVRLEKALFLRLKKWCDDNHCPLRVLTTGYNAFPDFPLGWDNGDANKNFFALAPQFFSEHEIEFHDLGPEMRQATGGDYKSVVIGGDFHPNERGQQLMARLAWPWLKGQLEWVAGQTNSVTNSTK